MRYNKLKYFYKFLNLLGSNYWNTRYMLGGDSGYKNMNMSDEYINYVWSIIEKVAGKQNDIIDVGCGDIQFWKNRDCEKYVGIDVSPIIVKRNRKLRPNWCFIASSAGEPINIHSETVICMNTLYHIMDDTEYSRIIDNLISWSKKWIIVTTWYIRPKKLEENDLYRKYRDFNITNNKIIDSGFTLALEEHVLFDDYGCIWIFKRSE